MPESEFGFDDWVRRFEAMQDEASEYGLASIVCLTTSDPLNRKEHFSHSIRGGRIRAVGMLHQAIDNLCNSDR
jgi:hypothetical protein